MAFVALAGALPAGDSQAQVASVTYDDLVPILKSRCAMCHGGNSPAAGLRLDSLEGLKAGSKRGLVVRDGDPAGSEIVRRLKGVSTPRMPMTGPPFLSDAEIALFESWIAAGATVGATHASTVPAAVGADTAARPSPGQPVTYAHVAPILADRCVKCHSDNGLMGAAPEGYRLTSYETTISASDRVRVVPGHPLASELMRRIRGHSRPRMPRDGPPYFSDEEMKLIEDWIRDGARDAGGNPAPVPSGARVRLHGTLGSGWTLDGLELNVSGGTRLDKSPGPGSYVEVRGTIRPDGLIGVERLRGR